MKQLGAVSFATQMTVKGVTVMVDILPPETEKDKPQTNGRGKPEALAPDLDVAVNFLKRLHPGAPWETLTAIVPDGDTKTRSFADPGGGQGPVSDDTRGEEVAAPDRGS